MDLVPHSDPPLVASSEATLRSALVGAGSSGSWQSREQSQSGLGSGTASSTCLRDAQKRFHNRRVHLLPPGNLPSVPYCSFGRETLCPYVNKLSPLYHPTDPNVTLRTRGLCHEPLRSNHIWHFIPPSRHHSTSLRTKATI